MKILFVLFFAVIGFCGSAQNSHVKKTSSNKKKTQAVVEYINLDASESVPVIMQKNCFKKKCFTPTGNVTGI